MVYLKRATSRCPPGVVCISPGVFGLAFAAIAAFLAWLFYKPAARYVYAPPPVQQQQAIEPTPISIQIANETQGGDGRFQIAPKPERQWMTQPDIPSYVEVVGKLPRFPTQGLPESYQSMGVITVEDGKVLPLYGRRTTARSDRFQYYTRTDTYNPVQLPITYKRRSCQDDVGCDELFDGEEVKILPTKQTGKATIYRFDGPTYIPGLI